MTDQEKSAEIARLKMCITSAMETEATARQEVDTMREVVADFTKKLLELI